MFILLFGENKTAVDKTGLITNCAVLKVVLGVPRSRSNFYALLVNKHQLACGAKTFLTSSTATTIVNEHYRILVANLYEPNCLQGQKTRSDKNNKS